MSFVKVMEPMDTPYNWHIRELLVGPQKEVADLTAEIQRLQALISQLAEKRDRLNEFINPHHAR
ncbi:hypothetical protein B0H19DRAFT_1259372 [Mycena capillaripes]|nr:hypothetical protein B0H19DRAFT_1259372 [Mycena capillaripes]